MVLGVMVNYKWLIVNGCIIGIVRAYGIRPE